MHLLERLVYVPEVEDAENYKQVVFRYFSDMTVENKRTQADTFIL